MKNLVFLINSLGSGGAERVASVVANDLSKEYSVLFYTLEEDKFYSLSECVAYRTLSDSNFRTSKIMKCLHLPIVLIRYLREIKKTRFCVLISFLELSNFLNIVVGKILKKPVVISVHALPFMEYKRGIKSKIYIFLIKKLYPKADCVITVSKGIKKILLEKYGVPEDKIKVVYNIHTIESCLKNSEELLDEKFCKIFENSFVFINVGRICEAKGQWYLVRSFSSVVKKHKNAKLIILGDGPLIGELGRLIKRIKMGNNVFLLGNQENPFNFLKHSDCFVLTSLWESWSNALVEALSLSLPIISTDCKVGPREILAPELKIDDKICYPYFTDYGILIKSFKREIVFKTLEETPLGEDENSLANLMMRIIEDGNLKKKYSKGLKRAKDFDVGKIIKEWRNVVEKF